MSTTEIMPPEDAEALLAAAFRHEAARRPAAVLAATDAVLAQPGLPAATHGTALLLRAHALRDAGRLPEALAAAEALRALLPDEPAGMLALAMLTVLDGRHHQALPLFEAILARDPGHAPAHYGRAMALLVQGELAAGFAEHEWRWRGGVPGSGLVAEEATLLRAGDAVAGKRLLLHWEQGLGDSMQMLRYVPLLAAQGASLHLVLQPPLHRLVRQSMGGEAIQVVEPGTAAVTCDRHALLGSLPAICGTTRRSIPRQLPYLFAEPVAAAGWRQRLRQASPAARLRVGFCWAGSAVHRNDHARSMPLSLLLPALAQPGIQAVPLRPEVTAAEQALLATLPDLLLPGPFGDFADTAALLAALDLVVTVDTAIAHLAGAMGIPCCVLLPAAVDWRWGEAGSRSDWYPRSTLLRQASAGDWPSVVAQQQPRLAP